MRKAAPITHVAVRFKRERKLVPAKHRHDRLQQMRDVQEDLDEQLSRLMDANVHESGDYTPVESGVDVADLFHRLVEFNCGDDAEGWWANLAGVRIPVLRRIAAMAGRYGLSNAAKLIREHIALRRLK